MTALLAIPMAVSAPAATVGSFIRRELHVTRYKVARVDLNGDGRPEVLVYAEGPDACGSGGCDLYILTPKGGSYRVVTNISITRPPIRVLSTSSHGWRDLSVFVAGGGILPGYTARLRFDGGGCPGNPTVPPAIPTSGRAGRVVISR